MEIKAFHGIERDSGKKDAVGEHYHYSCWKINSTKARNMSHLSLGILKYGRRDKYLHKLLFPRYDVMFK